MKERKRELNQRKEKRKEPLLTLHFQELVVRLNERKEHNGLKWNGGKRGSFLSLNITPNSDSLGLLWMSGMVWEMKCEERARASFPFITTLSSLHISSPFTLHHQELTVRMREARNEPWTEWQWMSGEWQAVGFWVFVPFVLCLSIKLKTRDACFV